jgi:HEAT repeat protein
MAARSVDDQFAELDALKRAPVNDATIAQLHKALEQKSNFVVARAASVAAALNVTSKLREPFESAFKRYIAGNDRGCAATTAIVKALAAGECDSEDAYAAGAVHVQMEASWGPPVDAAVELRCESVAALVRMNSRRMWEPLVKLLADKHAQARATAARALGATGQDSGKWLLQYKLLIGDDEASVMGECFSAICRLTRSIELVEPFLTDAHEAIAEAAAIALGESRLPAAFERLKRESPRATRDFHRVVLVSIAMTRQPGAVEFLIEQLLESPLQGDHAMQALAMYRSDSNVRQKVQGACGNSSTLAALFQKHFERA